jgi:hypothetical protein
LPGAAVTANTPLPVGTLIQAASPSSSGAMLVVPLANCPGRPLKVVGGEAPVNGVLALPRAWNKGRPLASLLLA